MTFTIGTVNLFLTHRIEIRVRFALMAKMNGHSFSKPIFDVGQIGICLVNGYYNGAKSMKIFQNAVGRGLSQFPFWNIEAHKLKPHYRRMFTHSGFLTFGLGLQIKILRDFNTGCWVFEKFLCYQLFTGLPNFSVERVVL